jgi:hypothetical protein
MRREPNVSDSFSELSPTTSFPRCDESRSTWRSAPPTEASTPVLPGYLRE